MFQQILRLVCRLDEESICKSHAKMPACEDSDKDNRIDSDAEVDGMIDCNDLKDFHVSSEMSESSSAEDSASSTDY